MEHLTLFKNHKERQIFFLSLLLLFSINIFLEFKKYQTFIQEEVYKSTGTIVNVYPKEKHNVLKIKTNDFTFFTSVNKQLKLENFQNISIFLITENINFLSFLKGFYTKSFGIEQLQKNITNKELLYRYISTQHNNNDITSLYSALFLATPLTADIRELSSKLGISHLIAISGFHLGVISIVFYFIIHLLYTKLHQSFFPYRNKRYDIMIFVSLILFIYLVFIDNPPSLLRAFVMFIFALFLLRNNIKLISFETLFIITIFIISIFPKLLFSLSLWFSIAGVFYIFLFIKYFKKLNKYIQFLFFNFWIYLAINPITHYFFGTTSMEQIISPILTMLFTLFYPLTVVLHFIGMGGVFDSILEVVLNTEIYSIEVFTPFYLFILYLITSLISVIKKDAFIVLNIFIILYNLWLSRFLF